MELSKQPTETRDQETSKVGAKKGSLPPEPTSPKKLPQNASPTRSVKSASPKRETLTDDSLQSVQKKVVVIDNSQQLERELAKIKARAERFGIPQSETQKAIERASSFAAKPESQPSPTVGSSVKAVAVKKIVSVDPDEERKRKLRLERFGGTK